MKDKKSFGRFIAEKRKERGLTQADVAKALYVTVTAVSKWERGVTYPDITLISDLCEILDVSERELIAEGNDAEYRRMKAEAEKYRKISRRLVFRADGSISSRPGNLLYLQSRNKQNPVLVLYRTYFFNDGVFSVPFLREVRPPRETSRRERKFCYLFASLAFKLLYLYARGLVLYCSDCGFVRVFGNFSADFSRFVSRSEGCEAE